MVDASTRKQRKYFKDMMPVMTSVANVISVCNSGSKWLPHVQSVVRYYQAMILRSTMVPAPIPTGYALHPSDPTMARCFTPTCHLATLALIPGHASQIQHTAEASASGSASAVSFNIDGHTSTINSTSATHGQLIAHGDLHNSSNYTEDSDGTDLFKTSEEE